MLDNAEYEMDIKITLCALENAKKNNIRVWILYTHRSFHYAYCNFFLNQLPKFIQAISTAF